MHALRLTVPQPWPPVGTVFHRAGQTGETPRTSSGAKPDPFVCHTGTPAEFIGRNEGNGPPPRRFPRIAGGRPFSADPFDEGLRPSRTESADPASLPRLAVYPRPDVEIIDRAQVVRKKHLAFSI